MVVTSPGPAFSQVALCYSLITTVSSYCLQPGKLPHLFL